MMPTTPETGHERAAREYREATANTPAPVPDADSVALVRDEYGPGKRRHLAVELLAAALADCEAQVAQLAKERDALQRQVEGHAERVYAQSELLSRRAEKPAPDALAEVRRDVRTVLHSTDTAAMGPAITRLEKWAGESS